jgi:hypothetical protein
MSKALFGIWLAGDLATLVYLLFFDGTQYNWWNWLLIVPIDVFLATIWPIYWLILRPFFS